MSDNIRVGSKFQFFPGTSAHRQFPYTYYISKIVMRHGDVRSIDEIHWKCTEPREHFKHRGDEDGDIDSTGVGMNYRRTFESKGGSWSVCFLQDNRKEFTDEEYESLLV